MRLHSFRRLLVVSLLACCLPLLAGATTKPRVLVLTDMGADPDDEQSLVRLLLYANQLDIEGIVATTSCWQQNNIRPDFIHTILDAYAKVQPNLLLHEPGFPTADTLRARVKEGMPKYGLTGVGEGMDTEGSDWIIRVLEQDDDRPLWISVWGGPNVLAQALHTLRATRSARRSTRSSQARIIRPVASPCQLRSQPWHPSGPVHPP